MDVELPQLADTLVEGTVSRWLRQIGEPVHRGEPLVEIETDKVNSELEAPVDGVLSEILVAEGTTVPVGEVIARIATGEATDAAVTTEPAEPVAGRRSDRLAEHLRRSAKAVPQGACAREVPAAVVERLAAAVTVANGLAITVLPPSRSHLAMPPLSRETPALLVAGAERDGSRWLTLCYDRRVLDDWAADRLLRRIAEALVEGS